MANTPKRLESSVHSFRLTLESLEGNHQRTLAKIAAYQKTGRDATFTGIEDFELIAFLVVKECGRLAHIESPSGRDAHAP